MGLPLIKNDQVYTYGDYAGWPDEERWELIDGIAYNMCAAPSLKHQRVSRKLSSKIDSYLTGRFCEMFSAPFDVTFPQFPEQDPDEVLTVVQPDISVICDSSKLTEKGCTGAPDLIIEILSPHTSKKDLNEKFRLYEREGVSEYWIVDPISCYVQVFSLMEEGKYDEGTLTPPADWREKNSTIQSNVLKGFSIKPEEIFTET